MQSKGVFVLGPTDETMGLTREKEGPQPASQPDLEIPGSQEAPFRSYHYVLRIEIVAEGAVIKVDFVEGLGGEPDHLTLVEAAVLVLADDLLACGDALQGALGTLGKTCWSYSHKATHLRMKNATDNHKITALFHNKMSTSLQSQDSMLPQAFTPPESHSYINYFSIFLSP